MTRKTTKKPTKTSPRDLEWTALEQVPQKRWWWYLGFVFLGVGGATLALAKGQWLLAGVIVTAVGAVLAVYRATPRTMTVSLEPAALVLNGTHLDLAEFQAFTVTDEGDKPTIALVPRRVFRVGPVIALTGTRRDARIIEPLARVLPRQEERRNALDWLARWLRLS